MCRDMEMRQLQLPRQGEHQGHVFWCFFQSELVGCGSTQWVDGDGIGRSGRETAREGCVGVDVEFEEVEERVGDGCDGAIERCVYTISEGEWLACFGASRKGDILEVVLFVLDVLAGFSEFMLASFTTGNLTSGKEQRAYIDRFKQVTGMDAP